jgi:RimJ/RimL family protein N-acetyltransferase
MNRPETLPALRLERATDADFAWLLAETAAPPRTHGIAPDLASREVLGIIRNLPANWLMVSGDEIVGIISLKAKNGAEVEIGYGVAASRQRQGFTTKAVAALLLVLAEWGIASVLAETASDNQASQRVLVNNGFVAIGDYQGEDDVQLIIWRIDLGPAEERYAIG